MPDFASTMLAGLSGGVGAGAIGVLIGRHMLKKMVDEHFARLRSRSEEKVGMQAQAARSQLERELAVYPAVSELVYRAKTGADKARNARTPVELLVPELISACRTLTSQLLSYRLHMPEEIFEELHEYKHALQDLLVIGDILTRTGTTSDFAFRALDEGESARVKALCGTIARLCDSIIPRLRDRIQALQGPLALPK